ncbi:hypothetical protein MAA_10470 [Metarhizium robertsii ARSEF 23]|uniref:Aurovertin biosynthesis cluster transcription factor aurF n=1 Tax=Metarhizium robertsii (strain ARSEF 23 / ATCC MYA-3075) TaxID=655844 RepID=E9FDX1_METRA|nr:uncharacterized protein MAA_10470 [Metarhizium robertsii ARSEF 23]EFY94066.2 hypothetical protein MAA_10470 [Metarhizium robertsii ARSEF 23]
MDRFEMQQLLTPSCTPTPDNMNCFVDAIKSLLDESDVTTIHTLARRMNPFRIDFQRVVTGNTVAVKPVLVLENGEPPEYKSLDQTYQSYLSPDLSTVSMCGTKSDFSMTSQHSPGEENVIVHDSPRGMDSMVSPNATEDCSLIESETDINCVRVMENQLRNNFTKASYGITEIPNKACGPDGDMIRQRHGGGTTASPRPPSSTTSRYSVLDTLSTFSNSSSRFSTAEPVQRRSDDGSMADACSESPFSSQFDDLEMSQISLPACYTSWDMEPNMPLSASQWHHCQGSGDRSGRLERSTSLGESPRSPAQPRQDMYSNLSPGRNGCTPNTTRGIMKEAPNGAAVDPVRQKILLAARTCIRADYLHFLQTNLARWSKEGLWQKESPQAAGASVRDYEKLRNAYSCVCRLDKRMRDDPIRTRIALVLLHLEYENTCLKWKTGRRNPSVVETRLGRGTTSSMIDQILENIHPEWRVADARLRAELRADFHNRKRYGKRWWILTNALGPGLLILCSSKIAAIIKNTAVTITMLRGIADAIRSSEPASVGILKLVTPVADSLFSNHGYASHDTEQLLRELGTFQLPVLEDEDGHVA